MKRTFEDVIIDTMVEQLDEPMRKRRKLEYEGNLIWALVRPGLVRANLKELAKALSTFEREKGYLEGDYIAIRAREAFFGNDIYDASEEWIEWQKQFEACDCLRQEAKLYWERDTNYMLVQKDLIQK